MHKAIAKIREGLQCAGCEAFFSLSPPANEYLTGFHGSTSAVIITGSLAQFLCDFRYTEQAKEQVQGYIVEEIQGTLETRVGERLQTLGITRTAFDPLTLTVFQKDTVQKAYPGLLIPLPDLLADLRMTKTNEEIEKIRNASQTAEAALGKMLHHLTSGITEWELAAHLEFEFKRAGAQKSAFDPIVLFGTRSSLPHGMPSNKELSPGDIILIDCGCVVDGYCSDLTRTYVFGRIPGAWFEEIYQVTRTAQEAARQVIAADAVCREVDAVARNIIGEAGYGSYFGHGLGHGVGLEVHEPPRLNMQSDTVLTAGMVVTAEPGIYLPGRGGVRIEDLLVVTENGCETLTRLPKELQVL
ncbi:MAG TPA: Xaa-Pro peptidase family protein [Candidatus Hydrogenedentes bacterium]|nr:Xaa-Pro peptidase family protein [Candidatus Hydrogenedentota bacterium]